LDYNKFRAITKRLVPRAYSTEKLLGILAAIACNIVLLAAGRSQIVPTKFVVLTFVIGNGILLALYVLIGKIKLGVLRRVVAYLLCGLILAGCLWGYKNIRATTSFIGSITASRVDTFTEYVISKPNTLTRNPSASSPFVLAFLNTDLGNQDLINAIGSADNYKRVGYANSGDMVLALTRGEVDEIVQSRPFVSAAAEAYPDLFKSIAEDRVLKIKNLTTSTTTSLDTAKPFVVYISGIDTYGPIETNSRSDVNILAVVNPGAHKVLLVNTPRDYYVQLHGTSGVRDKLTHAGLYGAEASSQTLEDLYSVSIPSYVRINFTSFEHVIDTLGGVEVTSDQAFSTPKYSFVQGVNTLDGVSALEFSRARYPFLDGDRTRGKDQQRVIEAVVTKLASPRLLVRYTQLLSAFEGNIQTNIDPVSITKLVNTQLNDIQKWQVESISVDGSGQSAPTYSFGSQELYVMEPYQDSLSAAQNKIQDYLRSPTNQ
jgi:polyisoprenyl-teichoic acid--peptidoglycan teichoic acid transferase